MNVIKSVRNIEVIEVSISTGDGTAENPNRIETQYWTRDGKFLASDFPCVIENETFPFHQP